MAENQLSANSTISRDLVAALVVFLVAVPLCTGVAIASGAPSSAGLLAGMIGGILVGSISRSQTSVSGPAIGLTAIVAAQIGLLGSFSAFLTAVIVAGVVQLGLGLARGGFIAAFFPTSVIKGLLAAIGLLLVLKQVPHLLGRDTDPEGDMAFVQPDYENTFSEYGELLGGLHVGAAFIGAASIALLVLWPRIKQLKNSKVPAELAVVVAGIVLGQLFQWFGGTWRIEAGHRIQAPAFDGIGGFFGLLQWPDLTQLTNLAVYKAGALLALAASLETLLNLKAIDGIDPHRRSSPASRELVAQGIGNVFAGLVGGMPVTSVIVRSSINLNAGAVSQRATIAHGVMLLLGVALLPNLLNLIPLSCLAAILLSAGVKLAGPGLVRQMWNEGRYQFVPFAATVISIVLTDLVVGLLMGMAVSIGFILHSNLRSPLRRIVEKHLGGDVIHLELANQISFLNRAALEQALSDIPNGGHVLLDARQTVYVDPDVMSLIHEYKQQTGPTRDVTVSLLGFRDSYQIKDEIQYVDYSSREIQDRLTPENVLQILKDGNERFRTGRQLTRDYGRQVDSTSEGQFPMAAILSCIDSRTPSETIFDLGLGDIFSVRIAGNITSEKILGSLEYACLVAGAKLIVVVGHTRCGAVSAAVKFAGSSESASQATGCQHLDHVVGDIQLSIDPETCQHVATMSPADRQTYVDTVARRNVLTSIQKIVQQSETLSKLVREGRIAIVGGMYDVVTGMFEFL